VYITFVVFVLKKKTILEVCPTEFFVAKKGGKMDFETATL